MTYGDNLAFFKDKGIETVELRSPDGQSRVLTVPAYQGRVMTSTTGGDSGRSYGWINHDFIASGEVNPQFNSFGGEERFWIGPEGGPNSWFFKPGDEQIYANWKVPAVIDTDTYEVIERSDASVTYAGHAVLTNASGREFSIGFRRKVEIVPTSEVADILGVPVPEGVRALVYSTANTLTNEGDSAWNRETGMPSVWLLGCFNPTKTTTVFIPYNKDHEGRIVKDDYFGEMPEGRLVADDGMVYFKIDGEYRAKIGLPAGSAKDLCGSYDSEAHVLNILRYTVPQGENDYVNSQWGPQEDCFGGDVINSYNDGPTETGTIMGPFYEIETSSPGAALAPGESLTHTQYTMHLEGPEEALAPLIKAVFGKDVADIKGRF
ncbi:MAG: hypothetical protein MJZ04_05650 [Bacteroidales bacterium]|nr:hypothetical protein [Bacteroidales bacterium]